MRITSAGKVGIGTTSPNSKLTVQGDLDIPIGSRFRAGCGASGVHTGVDIYYNNDGGSAHNANSVIESRSAGGDLIFRNIDHGQGYQFHAEDSGGTEALIMKIDGDNKRVGINIASPAQPVHIVGDVAFSAGGSTYSGDRIVGATGGLQFIANGGNVMRVNGGGVGIGTTSPDDLLHVLGGDVDPSIKLQNNRSGHNGYYLMEHRGSTLKLQSTGSAVVPMRFTIQNADIMRIDDTGLGIGTDAPSSSLHVSGGAIQKDIGESVYLRAIHAGFDSNAILQHQPNTQYVKAEAASPPGAGAIPTELPLAEAKYTGLEITVMQRWDADPEGALTVQKQTGSSDVIYEGGSNSASATVSIAAYRGANKTFVIVAAGVWVVKD